MNNKRRRGRSAKIGHNNHLLEGKSHIASRRLTIRPGFLSRGIASETVKKSKKSDTATRKRDNILRDDLHSFFNQASLRRSQRISKKFEDDISSTSKPNSDQYIKASSTTSLGIQPQVLATIKNPNSKAIVRNDSKSIFKEINEKYITAELQNFNFSRNQEVQSQRFVENQDFKQNFNTEENNFPQNQHPIQRFTNNIEVKNHGNPKIKNIQVFEIPPSLHKFNSFAKQHFLNNIFEAKHNSHQSEQELFKKPLQVNYPKPPTNISFCVEVQRQISVKLKKNERVDVFRRVNEEIDKTNQILQGKEDYIDMYSSEKYQPEKNSQDDEMPEHFTPVPRQRWVFRTPPRQKLGVPQIAEESCLQTGVLYSNSKNQQYNLYELKPNLNIDLNQYHQQTENIPIDNRYLHCVAQEHRTPFNNFGFGREMQGCTNYLMQENGQQFVQNTAANYHNGANGFMEYGGYNNSGFSNGYRNGEIRIQQEPNSGFYSVISKPRKSLTKRPKIEPMMFQFNSPQPIQNPKPTDDFDKDFTFIEENGAFKLQESQPKKRKKDDDFLIRRQNTFSNSSDHRNLFNFSRVDENKNNNLFQFGQLNM